MTRHRSDDTQEDPDPDPAALDQAALVDQFGVIDEDVVTLIGAFIDKARADLDALPAIIAADPVRARRMAHALKGAARMAGAAPFANTLHTVEQRLCGIDPGPTEPALAACADALKQTHGAWCELDSHTDLSGQQG